MTWLTTREAVKQALDAQETARNNAVTDRAIEAASRDVVHLCHREFAPELGTKFFDWPNHQYARAWRLWLNQHELITVDSIVSGGTALTPGQFFLEPANDGPPYRSIEINLADTGSFSSGDTHQRAIVVTGLFGYGDDNTTIGETTEALDATETDVLVNGDASPLVGVGNLLRIDDERLLVVGRKSSTTSTTLSAPLTAAMADTTVTASGPDAFRVGETILIDSERMLIIDRVAAVLTVKRAVDGSVLAAHSAATTINAYRDLTVQRGAAGTTATTHVVNAAVSRWDPPGPVRDLTEALAIHSLLQKSSGYARVIGSGDGAREDSGRGIRELRTRVYHGYGRMARIRGV